LGGSGLFGVFRGGVARGGAVLNACARGATLRAGTLCRQRATVMERHRSGTAAKALAFAWLLAAAAAARGQAELSAADLPDLPARPGAAAGGDALRRWQAAEEARRAGGPRAALRDVRIDPKTVRGREGFFRVGRSVNGYWWLIDPNGEPFFYKGVCAVNRAGTQGGRRAVPGPYARTVDRLYGYRADPNAFVGRELARLRAWGFNGLGAWTTAEFFDRGMAYTEIMDFGYLRPWIGPGPRRDIPDVFDPAWLRAIDEHARKVCALRRGSRWLVGYYLDNEIWFGAPAGAGAAGGEKFLPVESARGRRYLPLLQACLSLAASRPACEEAWRWLLARHGGKLAAVAKAWDVPLADRDAPRGWTEAGKALHTPGHLADCWAWVRHFVARYAEVTAAAVRRHDPNHLILGVRWGGPPSLVELDAMRPYLDVLSANNYRDQFFERMDLYWRAADMPILNGEFAWHTYEFHRVSHLRAAPPTKEEIARMLGTGHEAMERFCRHPAAVGYTWYRWVTPGGGPLDCGLVDYADRPNAAHVQELKLVNARAECSRAAADRAAGLPVGPIDGVVRLTIQIDWDGRGEARLDREGLRLAVACRGGRWSGEPLGGRGRLLKAESSGAELRLAISASDRDGRERRFELALARRGELLRGSATARADGKTFAGYALGFIERQ